MNLNKYAKAIVAALIAGLGSLQVALVDDAVSLMEWINIAGVTLAGLGIVWGIPNAKDTTEPAAPPALSKADPTGVERI